jgi:hypothetical protein
MWGRWRAAVRAWVMGWSTTRELYNSRDKGREEGSLELLLQFQPKAFAFHPTTGHLCSLFFLHTVFFFTQIMDNCDHSWAMSSMSFMFAMAYKQGL